MTDTERIAVAAHLHVLVRRHLGRATDVEWMAKNREYALEIVRIARASPHPDLHDWAGRLATFFAPAAAPAADPAPAAPAPAPAAAARRPPQQYVGSLR